MNGWPTDEFQIRLSLRHGDPLSRFPFILAMEGLHLALCRARSNNVVRGISISGIEISHLFYVDDVMLVSAWDPENVNRIIHIL